MGDKAPTKSRLPAALLQYEHQVGDHPRHHCAEDRLSAGGELVIGDHWPTRGTGNHGKPHYRYPPTRSRRNGTVPFMGAVTARGRRVWSPVRDYWSRWAGRSALQVFGRESDDDVEGANGCLGRST